jgi:hypothetical protein
MSKKRMTFFEHFAAFARDDAGIAMALVVAVAGILFVLLTALVTVTVQQGTDTSNRFNRAEVLDVADAGISAYVRMLRDNWYSYESTPAMTGTTSNGGSWIVTCTSPAPGSSTIKLVSIGTVPAQGLHRTVTAYIRPPSFADYMFLINTSITFGATAIVNGKVHSNGDVTVNSGGVIYGTVSVSSTHTITGNSSAFQGSPPQITNAKQVDFTTITTDLSNMKTIATAQNAYFADAGTSTVTKKPFLGYDVDLNGANYTTSKIYAQNPTSGLTSLETSTAVTRSIPASGVLFFDEPVWVSGTYSKSICIGDSIQTVDSASTPATSASAASGLPNSAFYLFDNLTPVNPSDTGQMIGLVAPGDISFPSWYNYSGSPTSYTVQAALLSQKGGIHADIQSGRSKNQLNIYGSMVAQTPATFVSGSDGFGARTYNYDTRFAIRTPPLYPRPIAYGGSALIVSSWNDSP